jgi:hypothetical protein
MGGLKGAKTMSVGNGSADHFHVDNFDVNNVTLGGDIKISETSLLTILKKLEDEIKKLKSEVSELKSKLDDLEVE